jgi:hypothetical protein
MTQLPEKADPPLHPLEYAAPRPRRDLLALARRKLLTKRNAIALLILIAIAVLMALRWPRFKDDSALLSEVIRSDDTMALEIRMRDPFEIALNHHLRPRFKFGGDVDDAESKRESAGRFRSHYDILRGEYYARLQFRRGEKLEVESVGTRIDLQPWTVPDARSAVWELHGKGKLIGNGVANYVVHFKGTTMEQEYIDLRAGDPLDQAK